MFIYLFKSLCWTNRHKERHKALLEYSCTVTVSPEQQDAFKLDEFKEEYVCFSCVGAVKSVCKHVWPPQRSKWPLSWQSAPGPQAAAGSVCPSRGPPGVGERQRCRGKTQTRGGPAGERRHLERLRGGKKARGGASAVKWGVRRWYTGFIWTHFTFRRTFTVTNLLFNVVHFQIFGNWCSPEENNNIWVRNLCNAVNFYGTAQSDCFMAVPFRSCSIVALLTGSTRWLWLAVAPRTLSFHCHRFPSNTDNPLSGTDHWIELRAKHWWRSSLGSFSVCFCGLTAFIRVQQQTCSGSLQLLLSGLALRRSAS